MYNQVKFWATNHPSNATINVTVNLDTRFPSEEAVSMAKTVLNTWGITEDKVEVAELGDFDPWSD